MVKFNFHYLAHCCASQRTASAWISRAINLDVGGCPRKKVLLDLNFYIHQTKNY